MIVFNLETGVLEELNPVAGSIFRMCDGRHGLPEMSEILRKTFSSTPDASVLLRDVQNTLIALQNKGMIEGYEQVRASAATSTRNAVRKSGRATKQDIAD